MAGFQEKFFNLTSPVRLRDLIDFPTLGDDRLVVLINEKGSKLDDMVNNEDVVKILPVVGGGAYITSIVIANIKSNNSRKESLLRLSM